VKSKLNKFKKFNSQTNLILNEEIKKKHLRFSWKQDKKKTESTPTTY
jgi:hypothetical protein